MLENDRKWVYLSYVTITALVAWILHKTIFLVMGLARFPNPKVMQVLPASAVAGIVIATISALIVFRKESVNAFSLEVLQELKKVTWPPRKTAYLSTIVVVVVVLIMSLVLGLFDFLTNKIVSLFLNA